MRVVKVLLIILLVSNVSLSQTFEDIDVINLSDTDGWNYSGITNGYETYYRSNVGLFDRIILFQYDSKAFYVENPTVTKFESVLEYLRDEFGKEDINNDFVRYGTDIASDDLLKEAIKNGNATLNRLWFVENIKITLDWYFDNSEGIDRITILAYYKGI